MLRTIRKQSWNVFRGLGLALSLLALPGCFGVYDNTDRFLNDPDLGLTETEVIKGYGTPAFASGNNKERVLTYQVRDNKYIILVGIYEGYDLIVIFRDGKVAETHKVERGKSLAFLSPLPWIVTE